MTVISDVLRALCAASILGASVTALASVVPAELAVRNPLPPPPKNVTDLKFSEMFATPVGPRGLEPSAKLAALDGHKVRVVGFMVRQDAPTDGMFVFAALPLELGDEDESLSDDLPPNVVFVHLRSPAHARIGYIPSLIRLTGTLEVSPRNETDGHVSMVRLLLDDAPARAVMRAQQSLGAASSASNFK